MVPLGATLFGQLSLARVRRVAVVGLRGAAPRPEDHHERGRHRLGRDAARPAGEHRRPLGLRPATSRATSGPPKCCAATSGSATIDDPSTLSTRDTIGVDNITFESDYPARRRHLARHPAGVRAKCSAISPADEIAKISHENAAALFRHPLPGSGNPHAVGVRSDASCHPKCRVPRQRTCSSTCQYVAAGTTARSSRPARRPCRVARGRARVGRTSSATRRIGVRPTARRRCTSRRARSSTSTRDHRDRARAHVDRPARELTGRPTARVVGANEVVVHDRGRARWQRTVHDVVADKCRRTPARRRDVQPRRASGRCSRRTSTTAPTANPRSKRCTTSASTGPDGFGFQGLYARDGEGEARFRAARHRRRHPRAATTRSRRAGLPPVLPLGAGGRRAPLGDVRGPGAPLAARLVIADL